MADTTTEFTLPSLRKRQRMSPTDYTIAVFSALEVDFTPMRAMLDVVHETPELVYSATSVVYTCGEIGHHNVVLTILPRVGSNDSGVIADQLTTDFPSVKFGLLVGTAGAVPDPLLQNDIRLGDIVVSEWTDVMPGIVQTDRGKHHPDGFARTGHLNHPPNLLLSTLSILKSRQWDPNFNIGAQMHAMFRRFPRLSQRYGFPDHGSDELYDAEYQHSAGTSCRNCDRTRIINRIPRTDRKPCVFHGTIGSSNSVV